jgi:hypothetical protein
MANLSDAEYQELKKFALFYLDHFKGYSAAADMEVLEKMSYRKAVQGVRQAVGDVIEMTARVDLAELKKIDDTLKSHNAVTLSEIRKRFSRVYAGIVKRGRIRSDTEYYLVRGIFEDGFDRMANEEQERVGKMIAEFEEKSLKLSQAVRRGRKDR